MRLLIMLCALAALPLGCATMAPGESAVIRAKNKVAPSLVHIRPVKEVYSGGRREEVVVIGSGFIISPDGYVVTNEHVAGDASSVRCVLFNKEEVNAKVVGTDPYTDLAVLKLDVKDGGLPTVEMGSSADLQAGQEVLALGSPHGMARSVSMGIISQTDRYLEDSGDMVAPYNLWIQTDAAINPGNSGGPLVDLKGRVVGINARRLGGADNVGFAIPVDIARSVVDSIIAHGEATRATLGLTFQEMMSRTDDPKLAGVVVADVDPLGAGTKAGVKPGDILTAINGQPANARFVEELPAVRQSIASLPIGQEALLTVLRGEETVEVKAVTEKQSVIRGRQAEFPEWGLTVIELTPEIVQRAQLPTKEGVLVSGVQVGSMGAMADLKPGDVILRMDKEAVGDLPTFQALYQQRVDAHQKMILLDVRRGVLSRYVLLKQGEEAADAPKQ